MKISYYKYLRINNLKSFNVSFIGGYLSRNIYCTYYRILGMEEEKMLKRIGLKLKELRVKAGYTSYESFAYDKRLTRNTIYRAERGDNLTLKTLAKLLTLHKVTPEEFFKGIK